MTLIVQIKTPKAVYMGGDGIASYQDGEGNLERAETHRQKLRVFNLEPLVSDGLGLGLNQTTILTGGSGTILSVESILEDMNKGIRQWCPREASVIYGYRNHQLGVGNIGTVRGHAMGDSGYLCSIGSGSKYTFNNFVKAFNELVAYNREVDPKICQMARDFFYYQGIADSKGYDIHFLEKYYGEQIFTILGGRSGEHEVLLDIHRQYIERDIPDQGFINEFLSEMNKFPIDIPFEESGIDVLSLMRSIFNKNWMSHRNEIGIKALNSFGPLLYFGYLDSKGDYEIKALA